MDRREFLSGAAGAGAAVLLLGTAGAEAAHHEGAGTPSAQALAELRDAIADIESRLRAEWRLASDDEVAEGRRAILHHLHHGIEAWLDADPARPVFKRFVTPEKKLLGDNPDAIYYTTAIDPAGSYRIRGNLAGATYTSFTVENGSAGGANATGLGATLNDTQFEAAADGSYEIIASATEQPGNWLELGPEAGSVTTRHYYEREQSIALDRLHHVPIAIEPLADPGPAPRPSDASIARGIRRVTRFLTGTLAPPNPGLALPWVSTVPNRFNPPAPDDGNDAIGFAAVDNVYAMAPFVLKPDEALVMTGRFPKCRFANVVLWNRFIQTFDYTRRRTSLNRKQVAPEDDGGFRIVVAARDPGVPNWMDTAGHAIGTIFWRFQLPEEPLTAIATEVVPVGSLA